MVAVAPMLFAGSSRILGVPDTASAVPISVNKHLNKHEFGWCCRISNDSNAISETVTYPKYDRLLPCPSHKIPPRIEHLVVSQEGPVLQYICKALDLPHLFVADLIQFGAVYFALVSPEPPPTATAEQIRIFEQVTEPLVLQKRSSLKGKTIREAQKTFRVTDANQFVEPGTYLRVHVHPKRFPRCYEIDWRSRIIAVEESYVVLDKPAGTSVGETTGNIEESCVTFATRALGLTTPLITTHQIDNCTEGCVVLARNKEYCSVFHCKIREKKVKKIYLALAASPLPIGIIKHYMRPTNTAPRLISEDCIKGWHICQLEVMDCRKIPWPAIVVQDEYCGWPSQDYAYECKINLLTGRTHQIRAQFAACKAPIIGDTMYMPAAIAEMINPGLNPFGKYNKDFSSESEKETAVINWIAQHGKEPSVAIGLQACQISWDDDEYIYRAGLPWWNYS
ncbi:putative tRNA pseudouridine(31) synthase [Medicago truncatula]|uniref:Putative tRNA pseudouridine(31) synthase n=1 Tax=Medicago truncatula TaxID=3880 RepID=A0A396H7P7_MEDTR|nr:RNA pseudouridine synthase 6, chloroplastic isoform X1 [Medicago truncatula]RHN49279.1 putative tRNA pseudouridine(31) synthase [Medicago truncatula]